jgi:hypothetical protein
MNIDLKWIVGFIGSALFGLCTWVLISIVDLKEDTNYIKGELFGIDKAIGRVYNYINGNNNSPAE